MNKEEYLNKLKELKDKKFLTLKQIDQKSRKFERETAKVQKELRSGKIDSKVATAQLKAVDVKRGLLREYRLTLSLVNKEIARYEYEVVKAENEKPIILDQFKGKNID